MENNIRKSNFELLRILAMLMIIGCHLSGHGVLHMLAGGNAYQLWEQGSVINKMVTCFFMPGAQVGTAVFFIISGYFGIKLKIKSILKLFLITFFYGAVSLIIFVVILTGGGEFTDLSVSAGVSYIIKMLFIPLSGGAWWYVTTYAALLLLSPLINDFLRRLSRKGLIILLIVLWAFEYSLGILGADFYNINKAVFFYALGYFLHNNFAIKKKKTSILIFVVFWIIGSGIYYLTSTKYAAGIDSTKVKYLVMLLELIHVAVVTPVCSVALVSIMQSYTLHYSILNKVASTTFGIFLFHDSGIIRAYIWNPLFNINSQFFSVLFPIIAVVDIIVVFIIGAIIDLTRTVALKKWDNKIEHKVEVCLESLKNQHDK